MTTRPPETKPAESAAREGVACYVYGVVSESDESAEVEGLPAVGNPDGSVTFVRHRGLAAVISDVPTDRPLGIPGDLLAHARVLDTLAATGAPVLPFRFGTVVRDARAVREEVLEHGYDDFATALDRLRGRAQFTLKARYEQDSVLREVLQERPEIREIRESLAEVPEDAGYYDRIRLGELVAESVEAKRDADAAEILRRLAPLAIAAATSEPVDEAGVVDASFLVGREHIEEFERAAEDLARGWHGRVQLRLLGPLAPYDFVADLLGGDGKAE